MFDKTIEDKRNGKILFVSHCVLNQNAKVRGIAQFPASVEPVVQALFENKVGIYQMPCPEMMFYGAMRWGQVQAQYDTPMFRKHCEDLANDVLGQVEEYQRGGYKVLGFVMVDGSPVCGMDKVPLPAVEDQIWGGMVRYTPEQVCAGGKGVYCKILQEKAKLQGFDKIPFVAIPEVDEAGPLEAAVKKIEDLIKQ